MVGFLVHLLVGVAWLIAELADGVFGLSYLCEVLIERQMARDELGHAVF